MGHSGSEAPTRGDHQVPVVLLMKGNPAMPQCGSSRAAAQILGASWRPVRDTQVI